LIHIGLMYSSRAIFDGMRQAVAEMKRLMVEAASG
jgi:pyridoxine 5'-phosphate synthase PdxJ